MEMETGHREAQPTQVPGAGGWQARPPLTVHPADADALEDGHKEQAHSTGGVGVKELEDVHTALQGERPEQGSTEEFPHLTSFQAFLAWSEPISEKQKSTRTGLRWWCSG